MKNKSYCWLFFMAMTFTSFGQEIKHNLFLNIGINFLSNKETHYTSNFRNGIGYNVLLGYERETQKSTNRILVMFLKTKTGKNNISRSNILQPEVKYEYLRTFSKKGFRVGGYLDVGSLLNFRQARSGRWAEENQINYTIWSSLGLSSQFDKAFKLGNKTANWNIRVSVPLISYIIRPSYTFPYTDNYLENDVFDFDLTGLGNKLITGGKLMSLNSFIKPHFQTGLSFPSRNERWEFGVDYVFDYLQTNEAKPVFQTGHQLNLTTKFRK